MNRDPFIAILTALLSEADEELLREADGLLFWRRRELRAARTAQLAPLVGKTIGYLTKAGTVREAQLDHLNKYSVSVKELHPTEGYKLTVVPVERVVPSLAKEPGNEPS